MSRQEILDIFDAKLREAEEELVMGKNLVQRYEALIELIKKQRDQFESRQILKVP